MNDHTTGRTMSMTMRPDPTYVARALRWAGIDANVTADPDSDGVNVIDLETGQEVTASALFSALLLAYVDAGQPATRTLTDPAYQRYACATCGAAVERTPNGDRPVAPA